MVPVLHVIESSGLGGAQRSMETMLRGLAARGWDVAAALPVNGLLTVRLRAAGIVVHDLPIDRLYDMRAGVVVAELVRRRYRIVHVHTPKAGMLVRRPARRAGARVVMSAHGPGNRALLGILEGPAEKVKKTGLVALESWADRATDLFLVESAEDRDRGLYPAARTRLLYNAIRLEDFPWSLSPANGTILFPARLSPQKDPATLIRALRILRDRGVEARVELAGDGELRSSIAALATELGLADRVAFLDGSRQGAALYQPASVVALTTHFEGQPYAALEAMAVGRPVVATACGAIPETLGDTGFAVPPGDPLVVADRLERLLLDSPFRADCAARARARLEREFNEKRLYDGLEDAYRQVLTAT